MRKVITILITILLVIGCGVTKPTIPGNNNYTNIKDSIVVHQVDSINWIPKERIVDVVASYDTLNMETSMAKATAYVDTTLHILKGTLENKKGTTEKVKYITKTEYRDSIQIKEVPYPVEVEKQVKTHFWYEKILWFMSAIGLFYIILLAIKIYRKITLHA